LTVARPKRAVVRLTIRAFNGQWRVEVNIRVLMQVKHGLTRWLRAVLPLIGMLAQSDADAETEASLELFTFK
jgi:hypothetical protein